MLPKGNECYERDRPSVYEIQSENGEVIRT